MMGDTAMGWNKVPKDHDKDSPWEAAVVREWKGGGGYPELLRMSWDLVWENWANWMSLWAGDTDTSASVWWAEFVSPLGEAP